MTDKVKPLQPIAFKNLAELKRYIKIGTEFKTTSHKYHPRHRRTDPCGESRVGQTIASLTSTTARAFSASSVRPVDISLTALRLKYWTSAVKSESSTNWNFTEKIRR